jgi:hypothetical protein
MLANVVVTNTSTPVFPTKSSSNPLLAPLSNYLLPSLFPHAMRSNTA